MPLLAFNRDHQPGTKPQRQHARQVRQARADARTRLEQCHRLVDDVYLTQGDDGAQTMINAALYLLKAARAPESPYHEHLKDARTTVFQLARIAYTNPVGICTAKNMLDGVAHVYNVNLNPIPDK